MHELISIEKSKLLPIAAAIVVLAAVNGANTTRQYFFELNHYVELITDATATECASWSELDSAIYKLENRRTQGHRFQRWHEGSKGNTGNQGANPDQSNFKTIALPRPITKRAK